MTERPYSEADLQAYVDGRLAEARRVEIEKYLACHPVEARRVEAYKAHTRALQKHFSTVLDEPLPRALAEIADASSGVDRRHFLPGWALQHVFVGIAIAIVSGVIGWFAHGEFQSAQRSGHTAKMMSLPQRAAVAHVVYSPDARHPVEIGAEHEEQLVTWLSKRLGRPIHPPKLGALGYELIGGRLLPGSSGPVAQFMYHDTAGQRLTLYVSVENGASREAGFRFAEEGPVNVFYWIDGDFGYALSAGIDKGTLAAVATAVYEQLKGR